VSDRDERSSMTHETINAVNLAASGVIHGIILGVIITAIVILIWEKSAK
jgi:hypothetical protein